MMKKTFLTMIAAASLLPAWGKEAVKEVEGIYVYYLPRNVARDKGEQTAMERAMLTAIGSEFGTLLSSSTRLDSRMTGGVETQDFWSSSSTLVRGEWVETIGQPQFKCYMDGDDIVIECHIKGKARELASNKTDIKVDIFRNDPDNQDSTFQDGDNLLLGFASATDGYLTIFLEGEDKMVYRMLPFYSEKNASQKVEGGREYLFFASTAGEAERYALTTDKPVERNHVYVVFSPNEYSKPIDKQSSEELGLRELSTTDFRQWIDSRRRLDPQLQVAVHPVTIVNSTP